MRIPSRSAGKPGFVLTKMKRQLLCSSVSLHQQHSQARAILVPYYEVELTASSFHPRAFAEMGTFQAISLLTWWMSPLFSITGCTLQPIYVAKRGRGHGASQFAQWTVPHTVETSLARESVESGHSAVISIDRGARACWAVDIGLGTRRVP